MGSWSKACILSNDRIVRGFHKEILSAARKKLGRALTDRETAFVTSRGGFIALETILDTVRVNTAAEIERYLNSE